MSYTSLTSIFVLCILVGSSIALPSNINWQCGNDQLSHQVSGNLVDAYCLGLEVKINQCCLKHDTCYDNQDGRIRCDARFCDCLVGASRTSPTCRALATTPMCDIVKALGSGSYINAGKNK